MQKDKFSARENKKCNFKFFPWDYSYNSEKVTSVWIIVLNEKKEIVCVELDRWIDMPWWHLLEWEKPVDAVHRECLEEAFIKVKNCSLVWVVESDYFWNNIEDLTYMLFYIWELDEKLEFIKNQESFARYELPPKEFLKLYKWNTDFLTKIYKEIF